MTNEEILNNAPEGATHVDGEGVYWQLFDKYHWGVENPRTGMFVKQYTAYPSNGSVHSLDDIRTIVEQEKRIDWQASHIEFLELAVVEWLNKTEWVQETCKPKELGLHRADVLTNRIKELEETNKGLKESNLQINKQSIKQIREYEQYITELEEKLVAQFETLRKMMFEQEKT